MLAPSMETPHYLRFVRALTFVAGAGCTESVATAPDAAPDALADVPVTPDIAAPTDVTRDTPVTADARTDVSVTDVSVTDVSVVDVSVTDVSVTDVSVVDVPVADVSPPTDARADDGGAAPSDAAGDVVADADPCPAMAPGSGARCDTAGASCRYDVAGGGFTSCFCVDMGGVKTWSCATAVPGPLPPPELLA
jgi:hypothetical protein